MEKAILNVERYQNLIEIRNKISYRMDLYVQEIEVQVWPHEVQKEVWWLPVSWLLKNRQKSV